MSGPLLWRSGDSVEPLRTLRARGGVIAFPTESSYGLGVDPGNAAAVALVLRIKGREEKPLPVVIADTSQLAEVGIDPDSGAVRRFAAHWPAPLTAVLPLRAGAAPPAALGRDTLAVRIPNRPELRALLAAIGPLTATSANRTGEPPLLAAAEVVALLGALDPLDAAVIEGEAPGGPPSTLAALVGDEIRILRAGPFPAERLLRHGHSSATARGEA